MGVDDSKQETLFTYLSDAKYTVLVLVLVTSSFLSLLGSLTIIRLEVIKWNRRRRIARVLREQRQISPPPPTPDLDDGDDAAISPPPPTPDLDGGSEDGDDAVDDDGNERIDSTPPADNSSNDNENSSTGSISSSSNSSTGSPRNISNSNSTNTNRSTENDTAGSGSSNSSTNNTTGSNSSIHSNGTLLDRLICGLSVVDCMFSSSMLLQPFFISSSTGLLFAVGNEQSCRLLGFFLYFFLGSYIYNMEMSIYFLCKVRYHKSEDYLVKIMEPYAHIAPFLAPLAFDMYALLTKPFASNFMLAFCMYRKYDLSCYSEGALVCEKDKRKPQMVLVFFAMLTAVVATICTWLVYWTVRKETIKHTQQIRSGVGNALDEQLLRKMRAVGMQAVWYTAAYMNGFVAMMISNFAVRYHFTAQTGATGELSDDALFYFLRLLVNIFLPIQGLFNCIVYIRPRVLQWRKTYPQNSWLWSLCRVMEDRPLPRHEATEISTSAHGSSCPSVDASSRQGESDTASYY